MSYIVIDSCMAVLRFINRYEPFSFPLNFGSGWPLSAANGACGTTPAQCVCLMS